jgi:beta-lactamase regulating signal transducer with metallopeptidase domain
VSDISFHQLIREASIWTTLCLQIGVAYLLTWMVCHLLPSPRVCMWLWLVFICLVSGSWLYHLVVGSIFRSVPASLDSLPPTATSTAMHWSVTVRESSATYANRLRGLIWYGYLSSVFLTFVHWMAKRWGLSNLFKGAVEPAPKLNRLFESVCQDMNIRDCRLKIVSGLHSPATAFWLKPYVLLPSELSGRVDPKCLRDIICHELTHIKYRDYLWDQVATLACDLVALHPAAWLARHQFRLNRELACDQAVAGAGRERRLDYAECLVTLAAEQMTTRNTKFSAIRLLANSSTLSTRIHALLSVPLTRNKTQKTLTVFLVVISISVASWLLPAVGVGFDGYVSPVTKYQVQPEPTPSLTEVAVRRVVRTRRTRVLGAEHFEAPPIPSVSSQIPDLFAASQSVNLPMLKPLAEPRSMFLGKAVTISVGAPSFLPRNSGSVWNESQPSPPKHRYRGWKRAAVGIAVGAAIALIATRDDDKPGQ